MVLGLANRNGHRNAAAGRNTDGWGGVRVKNVLVDEQYRWVHDDAVSAKDSRTAEILAHFAGEQSSSDEQSADDE